MLKKLSSIIALCLVVSFLAVPAASFAANEDGAKKIAAQTATRDGDTNTENGLNGPNDTLEGPWGPWGPFGTMTGAPDDDTQ